MKLAAASALTLILMASAAEAVTSYNISDVCRFDIQQYCKNIRKTRIRDLRECLAKHEKDLFPRCQDHYKEAR